ncbi:MAG: site-specific DNA-methyltransferase [Acidobacteria bacterium]|nr:site-specific DNA-methyltransferase [Acidobacteriota bacterium]
MPRSTSTTAARRGYTVQSVSEAKTIVRSWLEGIDLRRAVTLGLPEIDDRYHIWRIPLRDRGSKHRVGEVVLDAITSLIDDRRTTQPAVVEARLLGRTESTANSSGSNNAKYQPSDLRNTVIQGDSEFAILEMPACSVDLIFTSPPYFNARPEYTDYITYEEYLHKLRKIIHAAHRVLNEGRFIVINASPVLIRRASRSESSRRIAVPFDIHRILVEEGFDFIDDIIWVKPEGAGWATNRGRRFAADRNPLQYKPVPVTENVMVYRKRTERLIDWNIRTHPNQELVKASRIDDPYEKTNVWYIKPASDKRHPAIFPDELAERVIRYYSFQGDVVLDPFAGIGTAGRVAVKLNRRFVLIENNPQYVKTILGQLSEWLGPAAANVLTVNCDPPDISGVLL